MRTKIFNFKEYEEKWKNYLPQKHANGDVVYTLGMWMYPSGNVHMGHIKNFMIVDTTARLFYLKGYNVFNPTGWDAFGLPAENAAKTYGIHPKKWTYENIDKMKMQLNKCHFMFNWENEMRTCDKNYYQHQQKLLIRMFKDGYLIKKEEYLNWDPVDKTVLANEQVIDGKGWRSGALVEKKLMSQWFIKLSDYAEILLKDLEKLEGYWPQRIIDMQRNWIGKTEGYSILFKSCGDTFDCCEGEIINEIAVFTKAPYFINKVEFLVAAPDSQIGINFYKNNPEIREFIEKNSKKTNMKDYRGIFTNTYFINPYDLSSIPLYIGNYVEGNYDTGVIMGVPSICENDKQFAEKNNIKISHKMEITNYLDNISSKEENFTQELLHQNITHTKTFYRLKDWCISRQRYWGTPMPFIYCDKCGIVPNEKLPVELEDDMHSYDTIKYINCPKCGNPKAYKENDTMDTFVDSSWYSWKFPCFDSEDIFDERIKNGTVDYYVGGPEHATAHLLYARYFGKILKKYNYIANDEPFTRLFTQGMVLMNSYKDTVTNEYVFPKDVMEEAGNLYVEVNKEKHLIKVGPCEKMSKSKKNIVDPVEIIDKYGADTMRLFIMSDTPADKDFIWNENNLQGCWRFINKIWNLNLNIKNFSYSGEVKNLEDFVLNMFYRIVKNFENFEFNIAIAHMRIIINYIEDNWNILDSTRLKEIWQDFLKLFWCLCPVISCECLSMWNNLNLTLPVVKENHQLHQYILLICKNGKKFAELTINAEESEDVIKQKVIKLHPELTHNKQIVYIKNKIINFVI